MSSLHPPSKPLFRCLATTDHCVGLLTEPLSVVCWMSLAHEQWQLCRYTVSSFVIASYTFCSISLVTVTAISVDRLLALLLGLRYRQTVTLKRTFAIVAIFWIMSAVISFLGNYLVPIWYGRIVIPLCLVTSIASYTKVFVKLRYQQTAVHAGHVQH